MRSTDFDGKQPIGETAPVLARDKLTKKETHQSFYVTGALSEVDLGAGVVLHIHPALGTSAPFGKVTPATSEVAHA